MNIASLLSNSEELQNKKEEFKKKITPLLEKMLLCFDDDFSMMIAVGHWYQPKIIEWVQKSKTEKKNKNWEEKEITVFEIENIEKDNPVKPRDFIACRFFDLMFNDGLNWINNFQTSYWIPAMLSKALDWVKV